MKLRYESNYIHCLVYVIFLLLLYYDQILCSIFFFLCSSLEVYLIPYSEL